MVGTSVRGIGGKERVIKQLGTDYFSNRNLEKHRHQITSKRGAKLGSGIALPAQHPTLF